MGGVSVDDDVVDHWRVTSFISCRSGGPVFTEVCFHISRIFRVNIVVTVVNLVISGSCAVAKTLNMRELTRLTLINVQTKRWDFFP